MMVLNAEAGVVETWWLVRWSPDQVVRGSIRSRGTAMCSWTRHFTLIVPLSTQEHKRAPANLMLVLGGGVAWFSDGPGLLVSRTLSLPRLIYSVQGHVHYVRPFYQFPPIRVRDTSDLAPSENQARGRGCFSLIRLATRLERPPYVTKWR